MTSSSRSRPTNPLVPRHPPPCPAFYGRRTRRRPGVNRAPTPRAVAHTPADGPRAAPANQLNELTGEEWLYFTKSLLVTAYPSELGHAARRRHGANKPPRLMARLIEFFTPIRRAGAGPLRRRRRDAPRGGDRARAAARASGWRSTRRWAAVYDEVVAALARGARRARARCSPTSAAPTRADPGRSIPSGCELRVGDALALLPGDRRREHRLRGDRPALHGPAASHDGRRPPGRGARQPPDRLRDGLRRPGGPGERARPTTRTSTRWKRVFGELARVLRPGRYAAVIVRDAYVSGVYRFTGADLAARALTPAWFRRATWSGTRRARASARTATRGRSSPTSPTSTSWCCAAIRGGAAASAARARRQVGHQDVRVEAGLARQRAPVDHVARASSCGATRCARPG